MLKAIGAALVLACVSTAPLSATALVVFRTPDRVILATDSRRINNAGEQATTCKLAAAGRWQLMIGGFRELNGYDLVEDAAKEAKEASTLDQVRAALEAKVLPRLADAMASARAIPGALDLFTEGGPIATIVYAGSDEGDTTPRVGALVVILESRATLAMRFYTMACPGPSCNGGEGILYLGASVGTDGPLVRQTTAPRPAWVEVGDAAAAHRLIEEQIAATPREVGPPIDIIEITAHGSRWIGQSPDSPCKAPSQTE